MAVWKRHLTAAAILLIASVAALMVISMPSGAVGPTGVIEIEEDAYYASVSPEDTGEVLIEVSLRSTDTRNTIFDIVSELDAPSTWSVDIPSMVYLGPLEKKTFNAVLTCPLGERGGTSGTLEISAYPEGYGISWEGEVSSDSC
ncbi:MAG: hypothetical protein JW939_03575, partial [Candidatus Thermoplasmatota archaeon]|nr:hypothetical protein [Candidatus Thermoplasmatota archaeon]